MTDERFICTLRPSGLTLWLPEILAQSLGIAEHSRLSEAQYNSEEIHGLIQRRLDAERGKGQR